MAQKKKMLVWAHRGASGYEPENTLIAFEKAIAMKADGVELDVQLTKDDKMVIIHDERINRTSNGKGWIKNYTYEELKKFNFNKTHPECAFAKIPTLEEVYELVKPSNLSINVELKTGVIFYPHLEEKVLDLTKKMGMEERVIYSSFNHYTCRRLHELNPSCKVGFLCEDGMIDAAEYCAKNGGNALHPNYHNLQYEDYMKKACENNLEVNVWTSKSGDTRAHMQKCCEMGVNAFITNFPDVAREVVDQYKWD